MANGIDPADDRWYQRAVFYEVLVRGFFDSTNDGTGDLRGLTEKLDYLQWLGTQPRAGLRPRGDRFRCGRRVSG